MTNHGFKTASVPRSYYRTIVADPPWPFNDGLPGKKRGAATHYGLMTMDDIKMLPVDSFAAEEAHLYIWVPGAFVDEAYGLARAWGFAPKQLLVWVKTKKGVGFPEDESGLRMGMGWNFRNAAEYVLFATRGKMRIRDRNVHNVFFGPRREHSSKPERFQAMVEEQSPMPRLEMFARRERPGWDVWGDEV